MVNFLYKKQIFLFYIFCFCVLSALSAQTASEIETLLKTPAVTYAQAARFAIKASETAEINNPGEAFNFAVERNWLPKNVSPDSEARLDVISMLYMGSFKLKGGLFYSLFKNPHYAYRELTARKAFKGKSEPKTVVSGEQLLFLTSRILSIVEEK
jgi:hypothetical protein